MRNHVKVSILAAHPLAWLLQARYNSYCDQGNVLKKFICRSAKALFQKENSRNMNIAGIHIELTNYCDKKCWICRKTKGENTDPPQNISFDILKRLAAELPDGIVVYFHYYGEPMLYPRLRDAIELFHNQITAIVSNGKLILKKYHEIVPILDSLCISVFEKDPEQAEQIHLIDDFLKRKKRQKPNTIIKLIGDVDSKQYMQFVKNAFITRRRLFKERDGTNSLPLITDHGICSDFLHKPMIRINGDVSICCGYDPGKLGVIGNLRRSSLDSIWNSAKRKKWLSYHMSGQRNKIPLCKSCKYWGITS